MIIWINGGFGVGKTTTAERLKAAIPGSRIFDPEHVGYMLSANFADREFSDFQDLSPWRKLVPHALRVVQAFTNETVIAPQTVLVEQYWQELLDGMLARNLHVHHVLLDCTEDLLRSRIDADRDQEPAAWRHDHVSKYIAARAWLLGAANTVVDTSDMTPTDVSAAVAASIHATAN